MRKLLPTPGVIFGALLTHSFWVEVFTSWSLLLCAKRPVSHILRFKRAPYGEFSGHSPACSCGRRSFVARLARISGRVGDPSGRLAIPFDPLSFGCSMDWRSQLLPWRLRSRIFLVCPLAGSPEIEDHGTSSILERTPVGHPLSAHASAGSARR